MQYIDKSTHRIEGHQIIDSFLESSWIAQNREYSNFDYDNGLRIRKIILPGNQDISYYSSLKLVILQNQNNYCCYCMKEISDADTTLEHIIPHKTKTQDKFNQYIGIGFDELDRYVIFRVNFDRFTYRATHPQYPHDIAYYNLVASCKSNVHCNHERGSKFLKPLFYDRNIQNKVSYDQEGRAFAEAYENELAILKISTNNNLIVYRRIWNELANVDLYPNPTSDDNINAAILKVALSRNDTELILNNFWDQNRNLIPTKKDDLMKYKWFLTYFNLNM
ncbi:HNH endonuclease [Cellulophaga sp. BC115SP]|uniref:HNH endonuclease n=1 Tax=Cellulophaga sp. BC115SP TaxID=2683263 RepID=UPI00141230D5|nr:HNH endonuclease [Cellulophaga sp. BC115SP]NBB28672.1 hypothetical protein [Cellulophaga sp. BC115SP]